ncbi:hypothetical protein ACFPLB_08620 [Aquamicrobium segne]|uniref:Lipoprotein n=1 Tax=Aquamicrobium segne TaxID=469547 RepID=A0ABW0GYS7_9HYPH
MNDTRSGRLAILALLLASGATLAGCVSSPTYGTDKTAAGQLATDLSSALTFAPPKREKIDYKPRPELVKPAAGQKGNLPAPQSSVVETAGSQWPESPEQRRARIRDNATANQNNRFYEPEIINDLPTQRGSGTVAEVSDKFDPTENARIAKAQSSEVQKRLAQSRQGSSTTRRYLSEPPIEYRAAASTAPQDELGEDEAVKERRLKRATRKKGGLFDWLPGR